MNRGHIGDIIIINMWHVYREALGDSQYYRKVFLALELTSTPINGPPSESCTVSGLNQF
jgi:hypothetical protein